MIIGIIDTGIDKNHKRFLNSTIEGITLFKNKDEEIITISDDFRDFKGHGTGIASIILNHAPEVKVIVIKICSATDKISEDLLEEAIYYLIKNTQSKIINISMGVNTNNPSRRLKEVCELAEKKDIIISAAAYYKHDELCFPAHFSSVLGVGTGIVQNKSEFRYIENAHTNILCKGGFQRVAVPGDQFSFSTGTSLATAHFTGIIANAFLAGKWDTKPSLTSWLRANSNNEIISFTKHDQITVTEKVSGRGWRNLSDFTMEIALPESIHRIALFPFEEKEMKSVVEFKDHSPYKIALAIGYPRTLKLDDAVTLLKKANIPLTTKLPTNEQYENFDTLVIGYFLDKLSDHNTYFGYTLIKECVRRNKNFILWDKIIKDLVEHIIKEQSYDYKGSIYLTSFDEKKMEALFSAMDYSELKKPSICVIGTNSRQGKFTTQLTIKKLLETSGYKVAHLATEPQGVLVGSIATFPIGHNGTVSIDVRNWNKTLRFLLQYIEYTQTPDVIITGSQGGIIPLHPMNDSLPPEKLIYVKSFYPDALICTISPNDTIEFIKKTTATVTSYVKTQVLFYVMTPWKYKFYHGQKSIVSFEKIDADAYAERIVYYESQLHAPVVNIKDEKYYPLILDTITNFFAKESYHEVPAVI